MATHGPTGVRLLYSGDCPNWRIAKAHLRAALADIGADPSEIVYEEVTTPKQAAAVGFGGSPTILVDGVDPFAQPDDPTGVACRTYQTPEGARGAPTVDQLRAVLAG
jgi:hypothetical protein